jgi:glycosyltransferase involved in cell wall biosynthesis
MRKSSPYSGGPLRVLMVVPRFLPHVGGVEIHVSELSRRLVASGMKIGVLTTDDSRRLAACEQADGLEIRRVRPIRGSGEALVAPGLTRAIRPGKWDLVHIQHFHAVLAPAALWAAQRHGIPTIVTFHGGGQRHWLSLRRWPPRPATLAPLALDASRSFLRRARGLIAVANFEADALSSRTRIPRDRFTVIRNGCDLPPVAAPARVRDPRAPRVLSMGRLVPDKGHRRVLEAFPGLLSCRPGAVLWIAGSGPDEEPLKRRARELGVADHVRIASVPSSDREDLAARMAEMDILVSLSRFETHPVAVIEALGLGLSAVVADDRAGLREVALEGLARLVPKDATPDEIGRAILAEFDHPRSGSTSLPTWDDCARETHALYRAAIEGRAS